MTGHDDRALHAARNNADLYQAMFRAHGLAFHRDATLFRALSPPPPYHSAALVLQPGDPAARVARIAAALTPFAGGAAVKDGFATLDLAPLGLAVGFHARWIWAEGMTPTATPGWQIITTNAALARWEAGWADGGSPVAHQMFPPACLTDDNLVFCGRHCGTDFDAGFIVNLSGDIVGLSNVYGPAGDHGVYPAALAMAVQVGDGRPVTGFERGAGLGAALAAGFAAAGPLTVWFPGVTTQGKP